MSSAQKLTKRAILKQLQLRAQYSQIKVICGLGNPGKQYQFSWHNLGKLFLEYLLTVTTKEDSANQLQLLTLDSFMNNSGPELAGYFQFYKLPVGQLLLAYDDLDLDYGDFKISFGNSPKGHNGVNSVIENIGSSDFWQVRIGANTEIKKNYSTGADYILSVIPADYQAVLPELFAKISDSLFVR